jgi:rubredoxin
MAKIDCSVCGWRHTVPCGRDDCPHDAATHYATIARALDNAVANGCMDQLSKMSAEDIAYDLARLEADCERLPIEIIKAGVEAWLHPQIGKD